MTVSCFLWFQEPTNPSKHTHTAPEHTSAVFVCIYQVLGVPGWAPGPPRSTFLLQPGRLAAGLQAGRGARARVLDIHLELIKDLQRTRGPRSHRPPGTSHRLSSFTECPLRLTAANSHLNLGHIDLGLRPKPSPRGSRAARQAERQEASYCSSPLLPPSSLLLLLTPPSSHAAVERRRGETSGHKQAAAPQDCRKLNVYLIRQDV
ncbi:uncharacterized protein LOC121901549 [Thunnus maccoyii]|uniref:uncharacterized protein LOC121901549 n=1 Tax=Thunnus maccoyii TaxID=8240 RepID=UPI001C4C7999|nr:uncharacterized protein LOC121901549 [Thunnus maccoyii]